MSTLDNSPTHESRIGAIVSRFVAAGYPAESCRGHRAERVLADWLKSGVTPVVLDACIADLRGMETARPRTLGIPIARPIEKLERRVLDAMAEARKVAASSAPADMLGDALVAADDDAARHEAMKAKNAAQHAGMKKLAAPRATTGATS